MKITRRQLRQIIKESFSGYASERPNNPMERAYARRAEEEAAAKAEEDIDHSELEETLDDILLSLLRVPGVHDDALIGDPPHLSDEQQALQELQAHGLTADRAKEYITNFLKWAEEEGDEIDLAKLSRSGMYLDYSGSPGVYNESTIQIDRNHLRRIIKEELRGLNESISVDTYESLERALRGRDREELSRILSVAYEEGIASYSPDQIVAGIPGKTRDRPVDPDPHKEVVNDITSLVRSILADIENDGSGVTRNLEDITPQDMADAKRYAGSEPVDQARYLGIDVDDWYRIREDMDDWYEERHWMDQADADDDWYDLPELSPAIPDDHPSLARGPSKKPHPLDTDGDGDVDYDEIS